jgi:very-short-patch-repair endonuclease
LDPLPETAPAVVQFRPATAGPLGDQVAVLLDRLDRAAIALFPRWLPGAELLERSVGLGVPAVRALATAAAARSRNFGPFLADLAERGLCERVTGNARFPAEVRAAGLARVIADAYGRESVALLIDIPHGLPADDERALVSAAEWLARHGHFTVWLTGAPLLVVDRVRSVPITLPGYFTQLAAEAGSTVDTAGEPDTGSVFSFPPLSGIPRRDSDAEQALERALRPHDWARGRHWNYTYEWHTLGKPYRLDLFWPAERIVVEVDGPEHRGRLAFADDRHRDVQLQLLGHDVLRFPNELVLSDVQAVITRIARLLRQRRESAPREEMRQQHVDR